MFYIAIMNFTQKNQFGSVWTSTMDCKRLVLGGLVRLPQYLGWSWTSYSPQLHISGARKWTDLNLWTLLSILTVSHCSIRWHPVHYSMHPAPGYPCLLLLAHPWAPLHHQSLTYQHVWGVHQWLLVVVAAPHEWLGLSSQSKYQVLGCQWVFSIDRSYTKYCYGVHWSTLIPCSGSQYDGQGGGLDSMMLVCFCQW